MAYGRKRVQVVLCSGHAERIMQGRPIMHRHTGRCHYRLPHSCEGICGGLDACLNLWRRGRQGR
eukprot:7107830-Alexandrium_andersonii.AAC.1